MISKKKQNYATPTSKLLMQYDYTKNPVTRAVLREIVGKRIDKNDR